MTTREYLLIPPDKRYTLLLYGNMLVLPRPGVDHNDARHQLGVMLDRWIVHHKLGAFCFNIDMVLDKKRALVHAPDLLFVSKAHQRRLTEERMVGAADLCIDIIDPSDRSFVLSRQFTDYERYGITWYWMLDPRQQRLDEYELMNGKYECRSEIVGDEWFEPGLFPGLVFRLPPLLAGDLKAALKGKAKRLM